MCTGRLKSQQLRNKYIIPSLTRKAFFIPVLAALTLSTQVQAEEGSNDLMQRDKFTGNWSGSRTSWEEAGATLEIVYTGEFWRNTNGGLNQESEYLDNTDIALTLDAEKLWGLDGGTAFFYILGNGGGDPTDHTGDAQGVSNIAAPDTFKLYEAWYEQRFDRQNEMALLFGLYDLNSEFDVMPSAGLFIHPSQGIGPDFSQAGVNAPSIFPTTSLGLRFKSSIGEQGYAMAAIWDGVPGDPDTPKGTHLKFDSGDGVLTVIEGGMVIESTVEDDERPNAKLGAGTWRFSEEFDDLSDTDGSSNPVKRSNNQGFYLLGEYAVTRESADPAQGLSVFARFGTANDDINQFAKYLGYGLVYTGPFAGRDEDQFGLAVATAINGDKYKQLAGAEDKETAIELSYRAPITPWLAIQPDVQYIINPGTDPAVKNALIAGVRIEVTL